MHCLFFFACLRGVCGVFTVQFVCVCLFCACVRVVCGVRRCTPSAKCGHHTYLYARRRTFFLVRKAQCTIHSLTHMPWLKVQGISIAQFSKTLSSLRHVVIGCAFHSCPSCRFIYYLFSVTTFSVNNITREDQINSLPLCSLEWTVWLLGQSDSSHVSSLPQCVCSRTVQWRFGFVSHFSTSWALLGGKPRGCRCKRDLFFRWLQRVSVTRKVSANPSRVVLCDRRPCRAHRWQQTGDASADECEDSAVGLANIHSKRGGDPLWFDMFCVAKRIQEGDRLLPEVEDVVPTVARCLDSRPTESGKVVPAPRRPCTFQSHVDAYSDKDYVSFEEAKYFTAPLSVGDAVVPSLRRHISHRMKDGRETDPAYRRSVFPFGKGGGQAAQYSQPTPGDGKTEEG